MEGSVTAASPPASDEPTGRASEHRLLFCFMDYRFKISADGDSSDTSEMVAGKQAFQSLKGSKTRSWPGVDQLPLRLLEIELNNESLVRPKGR